MPRETSRKMSFKLTTLSSRRWKFRYFSFFVLASISPPGMRRLTTRIKTRKPTSLWREGLGQRCFPRGSRWEGRNRRDPQIYSPAIIANIHWAFHRGPGTVISLFFAHGCVCGRCTVLSTCLLNEKVSESLIPLLGARTALPLPAMPFLMVLTWPAPSCHLFIYS